MKKVKFADIVILGIATIIVLPCLLACLLAIYSSVRSKQPDPFDFLGSEWISKDETMTIKINSIPGFKDMDEIHDFMNTLSKDTDMSILDTIDEYWHTGSLTCRSDAGEEEYWLHSASHDRVRCGNDEHWSHWRIVWSTEEYCIYRTANGNYVRFNRVK